MIYRTVHRPAWDLPKDPGLTAFQILYLRNDSHSTTQTSISTAIRALIFSEFVIAKSPPTTDITSCSIHTWAHLSEYVTHIVDQQRNNIHLATRMERSMACKKTHISPDLEMGTSLWIIIVKSVWMLPRAKSNLNAVDLIRLIPESMFLSRHSRCKRRKS